MQQQSGVLLLAAEATNSSTTAWFTLAGALGGVLLTSIVALTTAILNHRWQRQNTENLAHKEHATALRQDRRDVYVRYLTAESHVWTVYHETLRELRRSAPPEIDPLMVDLRKARDSLSAIFYEVELIAGPRVNRTGQERYEFIIDYVNDFIAGKGRVPGDSESLRTRSIETYDEMMEAMREEILGQASR